MDIAVAISDVGAKGTDCNTVMRLPSPSAMKTRLGEDRWVKITPDLKSKVELILQIDGLILELGRAREQVNKSYTDAKEGKITEEFFKNQEVDAE